MNNLKEIIKQYCREILENIEIDEQSLQRMEDEEDSRPTKRIVSKYSKTERSCD